MVYIKLIIMDGDREGSISHSAKRYNSKTGVGERYSDGWNNILMQHILRIKILHDKLTFCMNNISASSLTAVCQILF